MPENPGNYKPVPPVTVVSTTGGVTTKATNVGSMPQLHASPTAMADPAQASRVVQQLQQATARLAAQQNSDPHTGRVIQRALAFKANQILAIPHGLGRAWQGAILGVPDAFAKFKRIAPTTDQPATKFYLLESDTDCTCDVEIF